MDAITQTKQTPVKLGGAFLHGKVHLSIPTLIMYTVTTTLLANSDLFSL